MAYSFSILAAMQCLVTVPNAATPCISIWFMATEKQGSKPTQLAKLQVKTRGFQFYFLPVLFLCWFSWHSGVTFHPSEHLYQSSPKQILVILFLCMTGRTTFMFCRENICAAVLSGDGTCYVQKVLWRCSPTLSMYFQTVSYWDEYTQRYDARQSRALISCAWVLLGKLLTWS